MSKIKVLCLLDHLGGGGAQEYVYQLCRDIDRYKVSLSVASLHTGGVYQEKIQALGVDVIVLAEKKSLWYSFKTFLRLVTLLRQSNFNVLHTYLPGGLLFGVFATRLVGVQIVHTVMESYVQAPLWYFPIMGLLQSLVYTYIGVDVNDLWNGRIKESRIRLIEMPIDLENMYSICRDENAIITPFDLTGAFPVVVSAGRLHPDKGHQFIIQAWPKILFVYPTARLLIAGVGQQEKYLKDLVRDLAIESSVHFLGFLNGMEALYSRADLFVRTSINEGVNMVTVMAMAAELPVIAFDNPAPKDFIVHNRTGWLVELGNISGLADAVLTLSADAHLRGRLGQCSRKSVKEYYDRGPVIDFHERLYLSAYKRTPPDQIVDMRERMWPVYDPFREN